MTKCQFLKETSELPHTILRAFTYHGIVIGFLDQKPKFWAQKRHTLFNSNHVLATTGKSCSKKKSAFAQIIKGENVILGDFLG